MKFVAILALAFSATAMADILSCCTSQDYCNLEPATCEFNPDPSGACTNPKYPVPCRRPGVSTTMTTMATMTTTEAAAGSTA